MEALGGRVFPFKSERFILRYHRRLSNISQPASRNQDPTSPVLLTHDPIFQINPSQLKCSHHLLLFLIRPQQFVVCLSWRVKSATEITA